MGCSSNSIRSFAYNGRSIKRKEINSRSILLLFTTWLDSTVINLGEYQVATWTIEPATRPAPVRFPVGMNKLDFCFCYVWTVVIYYFLLWIQPNDHQERRSSRRRMNNNLDGTRRDGTWPAHTVLTSTLNLGSRSAIETYDVLLLIGPSYKFEFFRALSLQQAKGQREQGTTNNIKQ